MQTLFFRKYSSSTRENASEALSCDWRGGNQFGACIRLSASACSDAVLGEDNVTVVIFLQKNRDLD